MHLAMGCLIIRFRKVLNLRDTCFQLYVFSEICSHLGNAAAGASVKFQGDLIITSPILVTFVIRKV